MNLLHYTHESIKIKLMIFFNNSVQKKVSIVSQGKMTVTLLQQTTIITYYSRVVPRCRVSIR